MVVEVVRASNEREIRSAENVVVANPHADGLCFTVRYSDIATPQTFAKLHAMLRGGAALSETDTPGVAYCATHRYVFATDALNSILHGGREAFNPDVVLQQDGAYLHYDLSDVTTMPGSRCVPVLSTTGLPGPPGGHVFVSQKWLHTSVDVLV